MDFSFAQLGGAVDYWRIRASRQNIDVKSIQANLATLTTCIDQLSADLPLPQYFQHVSTEGSRLAPLFSRLLNDDDTPSLVSGIEAKFVVRSLIATAVAIEIFEADVGDMYEGLRTCHEYTILSEVAESLDAPRAREVDVAMHKFWMRGDDFKKRRDKMAEDVAAKIDSAVLELSHQDWAKEILDIWCGKKTNLIEMCKFALHIKCDFCFSTNKFKWEWFSPGTSFKEVRMIAEASNTQKANSGDIIQITVQPALIRTEEMNGNMIVHKDEVLCKAVVLRSRKASPGKQR